MLARACEPDLQRAMRAGALVDTGALLAVLDRDDRWHRPCVEALESLRLPLLTSEAVLTELFHLVDGRHETQAAWRLVRSGVITLGAVSDTDLAALDHLMVKYHDRPMDFAGATLVLLARRHRLTTILTIDNADFETYRLDGRKRFRVLPGRV
jgi:hypothetical protein